MPKTNLNQKHNLEKKTWLSQHDADQGYIWKYSLIVSFLDSRAKLKCPIGRVTNNKCHKTPRRGAQEAWHGMGDRATYFVYIFTWQVSQESSTVRLLPVASCSLPLAPCQLPVVFYFIVQTWWQNVPAAYIFIFFFVFPGLFPMPAVLCCAVRKARRLALPFLAFSCRALEK